MKIRTKHKIIFPFIIMGLEYMLVEIIFKAGYGSMVGYRDIRYLSLIGYTSLWMMLVGGLAGIFIGQLNEKPGFSDWKIIWMCLSGAFIVLLLEFSFGIIFNICLKLNLWDYSNIPLNIMGQVCLPFGLAWFFLTPLAIWMDDLLYFILYDKGKLYSLWGLYRKLFTLK